MYPTRESAERALAFYRDRFGCRIVRVWEREAVQS